MESELCRYDFLMLHWLEYPSTIVEWIRGVERCVCKWNLTSSGKQHKYSLQKLYIATVAPEGEQNYVSQLAFQIPNPETEVDLVSFSESGNRLACFSSFPVVNAKPGHMSGQITSCHRINHDGPVAAFLFISNLHHLESATVPPLPTLCSHRVRAAD